MSMQATKRESQWISVPITQGGTESDWIEQQPIIEGTMGSVTKRTGTSATQLVCLDEDISDGERFVIRQDAAVYEGTASVTSFQDVEVDRIVNNIDDASYDSVSFSVAGQDAAPTGIAFNNDGTKMYMVGITNGSVHQYSLTTAFDLSTASYDNVSFSVAGQDTNPYGITFNNDGTKMFMVGNDNDSVYQYTLTTAFDLSTVSYDNVSFSVAGQDATPVGIAFNNDGTKMYMVGITNGSVYQYSLTTAFDLSTASYDNVSFSVAGQEVYPYSIAFNDDGTKMFMIGDADNSVYQYSLTTAFGLSTASYDNVSFYVAGQDAAPRGIAFNNDGTKMYIAGNTSNIFQYTTIPADTVFYKQENTINLTDFGLAASPQYVFTQVPDMRVCLEDTGPRCISRDTPMYLYGVGTDQLQVVYSDTLNQVLEAGDLVVVNEGDVGVTSVVDTGTTTGTPTYNNVSFSIGQLNLRDIAFSNDGTKMYGLAGDTDDTAYQYTLTTPFNVGTASYDNVSFVLANMGTIATYSIVFSNDGTRMFTIIGRTVYQYTLTTPWNLGTAAWNGETGFSVQSESSNPFELAFNNDGTKMYMSESDTIFQYTLTTPWNLGTASYDNVNFYVSSTLESPYQTAIRAMTVSNDGTKMFLAGSNTDTIFQYTLTTPWNLGTASYDNVNFYVGSQETIPYTIAFDNEGTKMFIAGNGSNTVYQYTLTSPHSLGGDKIWNVNLPLTTIPTYAYIKDRSDLMPYTRTPIAGTVYQYGISLSTAGSLNHTFDSQAFETTPRRAIQLSAIAGLDTTITTLRANLWKAGTPSL